MSLRCSIYETAGIAFELTRSSLGRLERIDVIVGGWEDCLMGDPPALIGIKGTGVSHTQEFEVPRGGCPRKVIADAVAEAKTVRFMRSL